MLRNEVQNKTGLTRKAIEYYEEKGIIDPVRLENGYRDYSEEDVEILEKVALFTKLGLSLKEIREIIFDEGNLSSVLRTRQYELSVEEKKKEILEMIVKGADKSKIDEKVKNLEMTDTIYKKLVNVFPGYYGQMFFSAYKPFLNEPLEEDGRDAFEKFVEYLDSLPEFNLTDEEKEYLDKISTGFDMETLEEINKSKIDAVSNSKEWIEENREFLDEYEKYKNSDEYKNSEVKKLQDKLTKYMADNNYYEVAIPLIRKFSPSYDEYYRKLIKANEDYLKR
ncbi:MerR family transcriptional regulator [uncultured Peptoniphilus sp.]|uniref:MerR family transcriptional regulator n=1 Tax=uncultured Peptoniphilus sp. TaxID=254354 RepID=UPI002803889D|nr:MerR family transcriptional regulator [uncultured Peptoniphilus sp.]